MGEMTEKELTYGGNSLLLAPNYVKDVQVRFDALDKTRDKGTVTVQIEISKAEAAKLRNTPGMDDNQFVAFLMPCIQTSIYKTLDQGMGRRKGRNRVEIEEAAEAPMAEEYETTEVDLFKKDY